MSIVRPDGTPNTQNHRRGEVAEGPGTVQNGFLAAGFKNTGSIAVIIDDQEFAPGATYNLPQIVGKQYAEDVTYDATGSTLEITAIY